MLKVPVKDDVSLLTNNNQFVVTVRAIKENKKKTLDIKQYPLTAIGKELFRVIGVSNSSQDIIQFGKTLKNANENNFYLSVNHILLYNNDRITYTSKNILKDGNVDNNDI